MIRVSVTPDLIRWARERSGLTKDTLVKKFPKFLKWESGEENPTLHQLEDLAKKTSTPLGYFFLSEPPEEKLPIQDFRTVTGGEVKRPSPDLLETIQTMQRRQGWMRDYLIEQGEEPLKFVGSSSLDNNPNEVALRIRRVLKLQKGWAQENSTWEAAFQCLRSETENTGILVIINGIVGNNTHRKLDPNEFRGFVLVDEHAPLVFINGADGKAAQMFTLAHELAHIWIGRGGIFNFEQLQPANEEVEIFCNKVAAELLVPEQELRRHWSKASQHRDPFQFLAKIFKVSPLVIARRSLDLALLNHQKFFDFYQQYLQDERRQKAQSSGGDFFVLQNGRVGKRFGAAVIQATKEGRLLYRDAYRLTGLHGKTFNQYAQSLGFTF
ncbi:MAG: ImmA/IrrE family metallo-endopeptidase [Acidobacteria bacterium]|nr:ImmA/IrrE family metallo-endopeptidase [Acidobacteriota bacterium]